MVLPVILLRANRGFNIKEPSFWDGAPCGPLKGFTFKTFQTIIGYLQKRLRKRHFSYEFYIKICMKLEKKAKNRKIEGGFFSNFFAAAVDEFCSKICPNCYPIFFSHFDFHFRFSFFDFDFRFRFSISVLDCRFSDDEPRTTKSERRTTSDERRATNDARRTGQPEDSD